ncbi:Detected protein of confused Function [Hibiscus syriacus]|uniref:Detected protein of confused Function n=1 Tax=Hibiscus syriacus TaxID=106335 RepID=A0A6A2YD40_HIBSY|nr:transmembrane protein 87B-like [Hibiscus syriacus]KAE8669894.1 Detected protein of confused Function [Hibiscus syriacus]
MVEKNREFSCLSYDLNGNGYFQKLTFLLLIYWSCFSITQVGASIHEYQNQTFFRRSNSFFFRGGSEGLYALKHHLHPHKMPSPEEKHLNGNSFIRFESITFRRTKESAEKKNDMQQKTGLVEAIIVEVKDREKIGGSNLHSAAICCTPDLYKEGSCNVGEVIIHQDPNHPYSPQRIQTFFDGKNEETTMMLQTIEINHTGMYYLYFMFCDPELTGMTISGRTVWRNPGGYVPGKMAPLMTFFGVMSLAYLGLGLVWFLWSVQYLKGMIKLQYHITAVIGLGMCEMALWYFEYANFNATGSRPMGITLWAVTFTAVKKTVSRLLLLEVSMGFGVVRLTLGHVIFEVLLGVTYLAFSEALGLVENMGNIDDLTGKARIFLVLPVSLLDACFIVWIFSALSRTLEELQIRRSMAKFALYRRFANTLAISVLLSIAWVGYELYFNAADPLSELWQRAWIIPAFWNLLAFVLLVVICSLWAPSNNPTRYAYIKETEDKLDEEGISLTRSSAVSAGQSAAKPERKALNADLFRLGEEFEEDKRE